MAINDWFSRMSTAIRAGFRAGWSAYRQENQIPLFGSNYDEWAVRLARYAFFELYATNTVFTELELFRQQHKNNGNLYRHIRPIKNPVSRLIKIERAKVYGGNIDYANKLAGGAIPIVGADDILIDSIMQFFKWSNIGATKNEFASQGATYGDSALKIIDDPISGKVRMEVLDPHKIKDVTLDPVNNVKAITIEYMQYDPVLKRWYVYTEKIDGDSFRTFKDEQPFAYFSDATGTAVDAWDNEYGFVPVRMVKHQDAINMKFGAPSYAASLSKVDELNDLASNIHDAVRRTVYSPWALAGDFKIGANTKIANPAEERDEQPFMKLPPGTTVTPLLMPLDIPGAMAVLNDQTEEIEKDMPQLALQRIREMGGTISGVAVRNMYGDASDALLEIQGQYDPGMVAAIQMGISIGALRRYEGFTAYDMNSYANGDLDFTIKPRAIFPDEIDKQQKITLLFQAADSPAMRIAMRELGYSKEDIDEVEDAKSNTEAAAMRGLAAAAFGSAEPDDEDVIDGETETNPPTSIVSRSSQITQ